MTVRMLTAGERREFAAASAKVRAGELTGGDLPGMLVKFASVEPAATSDQEIADLPPDLLDAATSKILELTGLNVRQDKGEPDEKKAPELKPPSS